MGMMDIREKKSAIEEVSENKKCCTDCKTTKTPLWRGGPAGPKSLCNACGIRYRKKRRAIASLNKTPEKKKEKTQSQSITTGPSAGTPKPHHEKRLSESVKVRLLFLGSEVLLHNSSASPSVTVKKQRCQRRRKLGEEEQAAFSLMALSCGAPVFA
ncbi:hypothetical protein SLA2020_122430 [Shorea laevis]